MTGPCISVVLPVYNEEGNIAACLRGLARALKDEDHEILVCYDFDEDKTLPAIAAMGDKPASVKLVKNSLGRGAAFAIRAGLQAARGDVLVTTMADLSDPPEVIPAMARKIRVEGADVVSGSRYMKGGSQTGGPTFKVLLSKTAGLSLHHLAGVGTHDATTNFRAYSRRFIQHIEVESRHGFELALELTVKAHLQGFKVDEVPSSWQDRSAGESRFKLWTWLPRYLRWYLSAMAAPLFVGAVWAAVTLGTLLFAVREAPVAPFWPDEWMYVPEVTGDRPAGPAWLFAFHNEHRIPLPKLVWLTVTRASGFDERWGCALNVLILSAAAAILCRALLRLRGRALWSDAAVPLLYLHWGQQLTFTWPFQVAFALPLLAFAILASVILGLRRRDPDASSPALGVCLAALPFIGASTFPFVVLLAPWAIWMGWKDPDRRRRLWSIVPAAASLLLLPLYFGYDRPTYYPPSPGPLWSLRAAVQTFAGTLGTVGYKNWPLSGWIAAIAAAAAALLMLRGFRRIPSLRRPAAGMLLMFAAITGLALMIGHFRAGTGPFIGFTGHYITLFAFAPFALFAAADLCGRPQVARILQALLLIPLMLAFIANRDHALDESIERQHRNFRLLRDIDAGMPTRVLAKRHPDWCPGEPEKYEVGLSLLVERKLSVYASQPAPVSGNPVALKDGRWALQLTLGVPLQIPIAAGTHEIHVEYGPFPAKAGKLQVAASIQGEPVLKETLEPETGDHRRSVFRYRAPAPTRLELKVESGPEAWMIVALGPVD